MIPSLALNPDPALSYGDYVRFSRLVEERFGLSFSEKRRPELEQGILQAFAASTCAHLDDYFRLLQDPAGGAEMDRLINALTVGETYFFRDAGQFDALYQHVLPEIIERRRSIRTLRIWSAGCASGEEPYSLAMLLRELLPDVDEWAITLLGTDVNTEALARARGAVYGEWAFREERAKQWRPRYFRTVGNRYELVPAVRSMVAFAWLNLASDAYPAFDTNTTAFDLILCRNVTIYFGEQAARAVTGRLHAALAHGGWLVIGHSEPSPAAHHVFQPRPFPNAMLFQRTERAAPSPDMAAAWSAVRPGPPVPSFAAPLGPSAVVREVPPPSTPAVLASSADPLEQVSELLEYGHAEQARDLAAGFLDTHPRHAPACALLGRACANLGQWSEAERWCRQAIALDRLALDAYYTLALVLQHEERLDEAVDAMKKVVYLDRASILGHFGLASLYRLQNRWAQAQKALDNARRLVELVPSEQLIAGSGGVTAGRLREAVVQAQQRWHPEVLG